jgi:hypothetical protein
VPGVLLAGCSKSHPRGLPPITQEGKNTFGCKVNGVVWVPFYPCAFFSNTNALEYNIIPDTTQPGNPIKFILAANTNQNGGSNFTIGQSWTLSDHIYGPGNIIDSVMVTYNLGYQNINPYPGSPSPRYFQITKLDTVNKIISGVFAFTLYGGYSGYDSVVVTDGRFDLQIGGYAYCDP